MLERLDTDAELVTVPVAPCLPLAPPQSAGTLSSHLACTDSPQSLHDLPCLLRPQIDVYSQRARP
jgi:hypothetical protein